MGCGGHTLELGHGIHELELLAELELVNFDRLFSTQGLYELDVGRVLLKEVKVLSADDHLHAERLLGLGLASAVEEYVVEVIKLDILLVGLAARAAVDIHELALLFLGVLVDLQEHSGVGFAQQGVEALESDLFQELRDVFLDVPLSVKVTLLCELNSGFNIRRHPLKYEECLGVGPLVEIVEPDEVPDLGVAEALAELILK